MIRETLGVVCSRILACDLELKLETLPTRNCTETSGECVQLVTGRIEMIVIISFDLNTVTKKLTPEGRAVLMRWLLSGHSSSANL